ncbi:SubName: Full=Uncharacterized protein {ECO:0000313/EMBL:CCA74251.1} [Serendipita indica DSM 11827]|uniref:Uncharacterized protein n=1 Tax=Serendipita indica (strain DSM 11827) TaxID=1109443 RepID=G4TSF8_SERID|nr:SubName: Full=Uncharacterized protein {ECO:0000313/EMBL:CCA74251.1} [Serendipita indica DSM 11827]CCA74251.1 hypothetical protein PIIN_08204 [Serendipita indica DSM 11827]
MFAKFAPFATVLALALGAAADLTLSTPASVPQCGKITFSVGGATGGYSMFVVKPSDPCGDSIVDVHGLSGPTFEWIANVPEGTPVQFEVEDNDGNAGWSAALTVGAGDASCLSASSSSSAAEETPSSSAATTSATSTSASRSSTVRIAASDVPVNAGSDTSAAFSTRSLSGFAGLAVAAAAAVLAL